MATLTTLMAGPGTSRVLRGLPCSDWYDTAADFPRGRGGACCWRYQQGQKS